jgi:hypothetical protein
MLMVLALHLSAAATYFCNSKYDISLPSIKVEIYFVSATISTGYV